MKMVAAKNYDQRRSGRVVLSLLEGQMGSEETGTQTLMSESQPSSNSRAHRQVCMALRHLVD